MTGQDLFESDVDRDGAAVAVGLVNTLATERAYGRPVDAVDPLAAVQALLGDDPTWPPVRASDVAGLAALAGVLRGIVDHLARGDVDRAAGRLNDLLRTHPAPPHLSKDRGRWRLHHHPVDAALVPMATAICASGLARLLGAGLDARIGTCASDGCDRVYLDGSKNGSRRFCSTTCQNRVKAAAFRRRNRERGDLR